MTVPPSRREFTTISGVLSAGGNGGGGRGGGGGGRG